MPFLQHTYFYHFTRIDHRHNFSVYNTLLHYNSAYPAEASNLRLEALAFLPQLLLSVVLIPLALARKHLAGAMLAQTFAFVAFNKVCTSQYFLWYMVFLPLYLPDARLVWGRRGIIMIVAWVAGQALWLQQGYELEFLGKSSFVPGLWLASIAFFLVNCWILQVFVVDIGEMPLRKRRTSGK
jgi:GPI mannosyltransferase 1 subunit M